MSDLELNKIAASFLVSMLVLVVFSLMVDALYYVDEDDVKRGYFVEVDEGNSNSSAGSSDQEKSWDVALLLASADSSKGESIFKKKCTLCHTYEKGGKNGTGPNLWGAVGRDKASVSGFKYSKAMSSAGGKWDYDSLFNFLHKPKKFMKGTIMSFVGLKKDTEIADVVLFLNSQSDNPAPLPAK